MDFTSLLSGFQEIGLKVNVDDPDGSMEVIKVTLQINMSYSQSSFHHG
jgi:hypothetical protein